ncbi:MAG: MBL fold metallo-hydrolase [Myxococcales bacterium]|nr:MBL fold metallo-hydrolase [Myxococcales bacterium]
MARVHHLNCGTMHPPLGALTGGSSWFSRGHMICHCWLIETARDGLILVDTGLGDAGVLRRNFRGKSFGMFTGARPGAAESALAQVVALGFAATDVRHIALTHLDLDHAGGLVDFPWATVHVHAAELAAAEARTTLLAQKRYEPARWSHGVTWATYDDFGDRWMELPAVSRLRGVEADVALVPLIGHTRGHSAVVVQGDAGWLMHAGDAIYHASELGDGSATPWGIRVLASVLQTDRAARLASVDVLRHLAAQGIAINSAHDPKQLP